MSSFVDYAWSHSLIAAAPAGVIKFTFFLNKLNTIFGIMIYGIQIWFMHVTQHTFDIISDTLFITLYNGWLSPDEPKF